MTRPNRPRDPVQLAATVIGLATGQITENDIPPDRVPKRRAGGLKGAAARNETLPTVRRSEIASGAARARWTAHSAASKK